jgi:hypothetical protein
MSVNVYDTTRAAIEARIATFQAASYPTMEVNYPKEIITDVEQAQDPFVQIEIVMRSKDMSMPSRNCVRVEGQLIFNHYARKNSGSKVFNDYTDALMNYFGLRTLDSITFLEVQPYENQNLEGFDGIMNSVNFTVEYFNI